MLARTMRGGGCPRRQLHAARLYPNVPDLSPFSPGRSLVPFCAEVDAKNNTRFMQRKLQKSSLPYRSLTEGSKLPKGGREKREDSGEEDNVNAQTMTPPRTFEEAFGYAVRSLHYRNVLRSSRRSQMLAFVKDLQSAVRRHSKMGGIKIVVFGSISNGLAHKGSDIDLACIPTDEASKKLSSMSKIRFLLMNVLNKNEFVSDIKFIPARIPVLQFVHSSQNFRCDLSWGATGNSGYHNSLLIKAYTKVAHRSQFTEIFYVFKMWLIKVCLTVPSFLPC